jgi:polysaccharide deacetylase 2 family uncharacterized protein YibQ
MKKGQYKKLAKKSKKRFSTGLVISLIVISVSAIIYAVLFQEEPVEVKQPKTEAHKVEPPKVGKAKPVKEVSVTPKTGTVKQKEKIVVSKIDKIPLSLKQVAIIIDDIGYDLGPVRELLKIDADITFAILPLCSHSREVAEMLHKARKETLLHLPMEPNSYPKEKPGNGALFTDMNSEELIFQLEKDLASVPYVSGVNNHMGSKFMADEDKLVLIFNKLKKRKMFFIDSRTTVNTQASAAAEKVNIQMASRKVFIDNDRDYNEIYRKLLEIAQNSSDVSPVIIIGHPYPETIRAIKDASQVLRKKGILIVPVSKLIKEKSLSGSS